MEETYVGGKARNMHAAKRKRLNVKRGRSIAGKVAVMGCCSVTEPKAVRAFALWLSTDSSGAPCGENIRAIVNTGTNVCTDSFPSYLGLEADYQHKVIYHAEKYVDRQIHTDSCENFWSLLKRSIIRHPRIGRTVPSVPLPR